MKMIWGLAKKKYMYRWSLTYSTYDFFTLSWSKNDTHSVETLLRILIFFYGLVICSTILFHDNEHTTPRQPCDREGKLSVPLKPFYTHPFSLSGQYLIN